MMIRRSFTGAFLALATLLAGGRVAAQEEVSEARAAELTVVNLTNLFRLEHGLRPLELDATLTDLVRERSADMIQRVYWGHHMPDGQHGPHWIQAQIAGGPYTSENLGSTDEEYDTAMWSLFDAWVASPTHLEILLRPAFNWIGIGVVETPSPFSARTFKVVTQVFVEYRGPIRRV